MLKIEFSESLRDFRFESEGAACFYDPVRDIYHCANRFTRQQAEEFAKKHDLELQSWRPGKSCSEVNCG